MNKDIIQAFGLENLTEDEKKLWELEGEIIELSKVFEKKNKEYHKILLKELEYANKEYEEIAKSIGISFEDIRQELKTAQMKIIQK